MPCLLVLLLYIWGDLRYKPLRLLTDSYIFAETANPAPNQKIRNRYNNLP